MKRPAVLFDRDGTLVREREYLADPDRLELMPGAAAAVRAARRAGYAAVLVTNQSGVGRGRFRIEDVEAVHARLAALLADEGTRLDGVYVCPHAPAPDGSAACACRKPLPGLARRAAEDLGLDLARSVVVGDKDADLVLARAIGARGFRVATGYGRQSDAASNEDKGPLCADALDAVRRALGGELGKVRDLDALVGEVQSAKGLGQRVVFANGHFDVLHVGHVRYLRGARRLGDVLVVAVNDDASTRALKGPGRPITPVAERLEILEALECVDFLIPFEGRDVAPLLLALKPDIHAKGTDYTEETVPEKDIVASYGGRVAITGDPKDHSSTEMIERMRAERAR